MPNLTENITLIFIDIQSTAVLNFKNFTKYFSSHKTAYSAKRTIT